MAKTEIADVIVPSVFQKYLIERTAARSALIQSGIIERSPGFDLLAGGGGATVNMPFWQDLTGARQAFSSTLTPVKITASADIALIQNDSNAWGTNDLAGLLAGDDPMNAILDLLADYWNRFKTHQAALEQRRHPQLGAQRPPVLSGFPPIAARLGVDLDQPSTSH